MNPLVATMAPNKAAEATILESVGKGVADATSAAGQSVIDGAVSVAQSVGTFLFGGKDDVASGNITQPVTTTTKEPIANETTTTENTTTTEEPTQGAEAPTTDESTPNAEPEFMKKPEQSYPEDAPTPNPTMDHTAEPEFMKKPEQSFPEDEPTPEPVPEPTGPEPEVAPTPVAPAVQQMQESNIMNIAGFVYDATHHMITHSPQYQVLQGFYHPYNLSTSFYQ